MKEILELRVRREYAHLLFAPEEGTKLGSSILKVEVARDDPRYQRIPEIDKEIKKKYNERFFYGWEIRRSYSAAEWKAARLLHLKITTTFEPAGEECGTVYDEAPACPICGSDRRQQGPLVLQKGSIPKKDIAWTITSEIVVSEKFMTAFKAARLKGMRFERVVYGKEPADYYQPFPLAELELSSRTVAGINPFNLATTEGRKIYKCPNGHTIGLNLLSEPYVLSMGEGDFFASRQKIGVKGSLLRPRPIYLCTPAFQKMVQEEKLTGCEFEIAHVQE